ncbi:MAG: ImmA/IrrE family metallo-endopeptidase [Gammaproteobacteria bacterium]|nr:ImmA/IrrE family metallo-endopeptidase [Gammaproteobacteria bacterium]
MIRAPVNPELVIWARERAGLAPETLAKRFPKLSEWETGSLRPTFKQVDDFAAKVHVPVGYLFLSEPPIESLPISDFRTIAGTSVARPSPDLLDVIHACQARQTWYRNYSRLESSDELLFISSVSIDHSTVDVASQITDTLEFALQVRRECSTWTDAFQRFVTATDAAGILVMISGIVGSNTTRRLNPQEFRGFALSDPRAPLIFINGADTKAAQMFTLAHELAHLWLGNSGLSNCQAAPNSKLRSAEVWCNEVAAEFLVPLAALRDELSEGESLSNAIQRLTRVFKVSSLVVLRRLLDAGWLTRNQFENAWREENSRLRSLVQQNRGGGGDFYRTTVSRVGRRFAKALVASTLEGQTLFRDAYRMLGVRSGSSFEELARQIGVTP